MSSHSPSYSLGTESTDEALGSTNDSVLDEESISPNRKNSKWSMMASIKRSEHVASINSPPTSFLRGRLFGRGETKSPLSAITKEPSIKQTNIFSSPSKSWNVSGGRKSVLSKADEEATGLTIDDALRTLYDESNGVVGAKNSYSVVKSSSLWWTLDEDSCYTKGDRDSKNAEHQQDHDHSVREFEENSIDENALTSQLFEELHADPLISALHRLTDVSNAVVSGTDDVDVVVTDSRDLVEDDDDDDIDFGDFQSAVCSETANNLVVENNGTRSECAEASSPSGDSPRDSDPIVERFPEEGPTSVVRALSFNDCENDTALLHYIDSLCGSPVESASIAASPSMDTPDLVRMVDEVIQSSYEMETKAVAIESDTLSSNTSKGPFILRHPKRIIIDDDSRLFGETKSEVSSPSQNGISSSLINRDIVAAPPPLSMILPVGNNLSTLESRFTRRLQHHYFLNEQRSDELMTDLCDDINDDSSPLKKDQSDLPSYYFTSSDVDDTISVLKSLPWQHVRRTSGDVSCLGGSSQPRNRLDSGESLVFWDEHITSRLCQLDTSLEHIQSETLLHIQPFQPTLSRANDLVHEWDQNLRLALMYLERSKHALSGVLGSESDAEGLIGATSLLQLWQEQEEYRLLESLMDELNDIWQKESELLERIDRFDVKDFNALDKYLTVLQLANVLEDRASNGPLSNLRCLESLRERVQNVGLRFWNRLLDITRTFVVHSCKTSASFDWDEYERLFRAFLGLKSHGIVNLSPDNGIDEMRSSWTDNILTSFSYEIDAAFASALIYPTNCSSHNESDLKQCARCLNAHWGDYSKLRAITHNLVNVRFEVERKMNYLPYVIHQLCKRLTDILHSYFSFVKWHDELIQVQLASGSELTANKTEPYDLRCVHESLSGYSPKLWEHCESIVAKCLDEYLNFAPKRSLFQLRNDRVDDTLWHDDLNCNYVVDFCVCRFLSFKPLFLGSLQGLSSINNVPTGVHSLLSDKLAKVFGRHLRLLHVEAMNTVGRCLANESWILGSMTSLQSEPGQTDHSELSPQHLLREALQSASKRHNHFSRMIRNCFSGFENFVNPFDSPTFMCETEPVNHIHFDDSVHEETIIEDKLLCLRSDQDGSIRLAPDAVTNELVCWLVRLLIVMERLPLIAENASDVIINLCDLYFTTVFRLCSGSSQSDRLVLGEEYPSPIPLDEECFLKGSTEKANGTPMFGSFRGSQQKVMHARRKNGSDISFTACLDGEICSPIPKNFANNHRLQIFICRAKSSLRHVVNLDMVDSWLNDPNADSSEEQGCEVANVLAKRQGAIWSCFTVAALLRLLVNAAKRNMISSSELADVSENKLIALQEYCDTVYDVVPTLAQVASQIACTRAVEGSKIVEEILKVGVGWEECKLHEYPNDYVDDLCNRCSLIWGYLCASSKVPTIILEKTWEGLVSAAYLALLEGFARVRRCSTEGRAHMTLDLASFRAGITPNSVSERLESHMLVNRPPTINPAVDSMYVETYIKAFYYPKDDIIAWINQNWNQYKMNHVLALAVTAILSSSDEMSDVQVRSVMDDVKALYRVNNET